MFVALDSTDDRCDVFSAAKKQPYRCPACQQPVVLRQGKVRIWHFAHKPDAMCDYGRGETELHLLAKANEIKQLPYASEVTLEKPIMDASGTVVARADVFARINTVPVAFELQHSVIDAAELYRRTETYTRLGIYTAWMIPTTDVTSLKEQRRLNQLMRGLRSLYFGKVLYYDCLGSTVYPVRFENVSYYVPCEEYYIRDGGGDTGIGGGYTKHLRCTVTGAWTKTLSLRQLVATRHKQWKDVPDALLFAPPYDK